MNVYLDIIPIGVSVRIVSKLFSLKDVVSFDHLLKGLTKTEEFINLWKIVAENNYYNPMTMGITEHPLIQNLYKEFIKLRIIFNNNSMIDLRGLYSDKWVYIYEIKNGQDHIYIRIDKNTLDIYSKYGKVPKGNLRDTPYHGFDLIDNYGVIVGASKCEKRLKEIKK